MHACSLVYLNILKDSTLYQPITFCFYFTDFSSREAEEAKRAPVFVSCNTHKQLCFPCFGFRLDRSSLCQRFAQGHIGISILVCPNLNYSASKLY